MNPSHIVIPAPLARPPRPQDYLDHRTHHVTYVTTALAQDSVPAEAAAVLVVPATDDTGGGLARARSPSCAPASARRPGCSPSTRVTLDTAAAVRERLSGCPARPRPNSRGSADKLTMNRIVAGGPASRPPLRRRPDEHAFAPSPTATAPPAVVKPGAAAPPAGASFRLAAAADLAPSWPRCRPNHACVQVLPHDYRPSTACGRATGWSPWRVSPATSTPASTSPRAGARLPSSRTPTTPDCSCRAGRVHGPESRARLSTEPWVVPPGGVRRHRRRGAAPRSASWRPATGSAARRSRSSGARCTAST
ncbi:hypothetical protein LT493_20605 [Streptomyces tricolor]|nr:hypothetical protein [Streptomyces tricolor]